MNKQTKTIVKQMKQPNLSSKIPQQNKEFKRIKWCSTAGRPFQDLNVFSSIQVMFRQISVVRWSCVSFFWAGCTPSPLKQVELLPSASFCPHIGEDTTCMVFPTSTLFYKKQPNFFLLFRAKSSKQ